MQNISGATSISLGGDSSCVTTSDDVQCWGSDLNNQRVNGIATWYTSSGWSTPVEVSFDPLLGDSESPEIVVDSTGLATAIWSQYDGDNYVIRSSTSQSGGDWSTPVLVADPGAGQDAYTPKLTVDSNGLVTAVWNRYDGDFNSFPSFRLQSSTSQSGGAWTQVENVSPTDEDVESYDLAVDSNGLVTLVWTAIDGDSFIRSSTSQSGGDWVSNGILSDVNQDAYYPQVAIDGNGLATAVWQRWNGSQDIVQASTSQSGDAWTSVVDLSDTNYSADSPQVVADSSGTVTVIWSNLTNQAEIIQARTNVPGDGWQSIVNLSDTEGIAGDATLEVNSSGLVAAIWTRWDNIDTEVVQVKTLELPGDWSATFTFFQEHPGCNSGGVGDCVGAPDVIVDSAGLVSAIWSRPNGEAYVVESSYAESGSEWSTLFVNSAGGGWDQKLAVDSTGLVTAVWMYYDEIIDQDGLQSSYISHDTTYSPPPPPPSSGGSNADTSTAQPLVKAAPLQKPKVKGAAKVSAVLSVAKQTWTGFPTPKLTYKWYACSKEIDVAGKKAPKACRPIKGANKRKFRLTENQAGKFVSVLVTGTSAGTASTKIFTRSTARVS